MQPTQAHSYTATAQRAAVVREHCTTPAGQVPPCQHMQTPQGSHAARSVPGLSHGNASCCRQHACHIGTLIYIFLLSPFPKWNLTGCLGSPALVPLDASAAKARSAPLGPPPRLLPAGAARPMTASPLLSAIAAAAASASSRRVWVRRRWAAGCQESKSPLLQKYPQNPVILHALQGPHAWAGPDPAS